MLTNLQRNLRHLCNGYGTAAEVCSAMDINRLQFNQYLNGKRSPSAGTKRKICDYYRVTSAELDMPPPAVHRGYASPARRRTTGAAASAGQWAAGRPGRGAGTFRLR